MFPLLETERLLLREITCDDAEDIFDCFSNEEVIRYYGQEVLEDISHAEKFIEFFSKGYIERRGILWGIERKEVKGLIGTIGIDSLSIKHKRVDIGFAIKPEQWRKGYTQEALLKIISFGFDSMGLNRIGAFVFIENEASNNLLAKIGFQKEGILRDFIYQSGKAYDTYVYSILKSTRPSNL